MPMTADNIVFKSLFFIQETLIQTLPVDRIGAGWGKIYVYDLKRIKYTQK
jgi:hypothetical protein